MAEMAPGGRAAAVRHPGPGWLDAACAIASPPALASRQFAADEVLSVLAHGRLLTRYQPIVSTAGRPLAMEVLIRAVHSRHGLLAPDQFVAPIEDAGHAVFLAETVALHALADWNGRRLTTLGLRIGINLPLDAILSPVAPRRLSDLRDESGLTADQMVIELTESQPIVDPEALRPALENWRRLGFRLSIDDVGPRMRDHTGLLDLPFNSLKIDRELVCDSATRASAHLHLGRIVAEAHDAGLMVIAEGIETRADWERMVECGVDAIQGYLVARPLTAGAVPLWLDDWNRERLSARTSFS
jgi:EAL domain-containing protein (putative c-di-GMP-specific phosphodiesterase class I)